MKSPAAAIAWSVWTRHRTGFIASAATLVAMAIVFRFWQRLPRPGRLPLPVPCRWWVSLRSS